MSLWITGAGGMGPGAMPAPSPAYLVAELEVHDAEAAARYAREVRPVMARYGGRILATSLRHARVIEGESRSSVLAVHRWTSQAAFDDFFASAEYEPLRRLRRRACSSRIVVFDADPAPTLLAALQGDGASVSVTEDVVFLSPAADYHGRADVLHLLAIIARVLEDVSPTGAGDDGPWRTTALTARIGDREVQGVLRERVESGAVAEASLYLRPYAALRDGMARMQAHLAEHPLPSSIAEGG